MGRKIPARKHHGIKDPLKQKQLQFSKIKDKIDNPPEKGQKIPYKLAQFMKLKEDTKKGKVFKLKRTVNNEDKPNKSKKNKNVRPVKKLQPIKQFPDEEDEDYLRRINRVTQEAIKESEYEKKYGVDVVRNPKTGEIKVVKKPKDEIDELIKAKKRKGKATEKKTKLDPKESKELIKQAIKESKQEEQKEKIVEYQRDNVKFGEVVHAPPTFSILPRKAKRDETVPRPGKKDNLLLKDLLGQNQEPKPKQTTTLNKQKDKLSTLKKAKTILQGKRKDMPLSTRRMIEDQQSRAVDLYRQLKKNKLTKV